MARSRRIGRTAVAAAVVIATLAVGFQWSSAAEGPIDAKPCSKQVAKQGLRDFVRAFNRGDLEKLDLLFDDEPGFQWFSTGPPGVRKGNSAWRRSTLIRYFEKRHRRHDQMYLRSFGHVGVRNSDRSTQFSLTLSRRADGFNRGRWFRMPAQSSKGAMICAGDQPRIFVMSLAGPRWIRGR